MTSLLIFLFFGANAVVAQTAIIADECQECHQDISFVAEPVNRSVTCVVCHQQPSNLPGTAHVSIMVASTDYGFFRTSESSNEIFPNVHNEHVDRYTTDSCKACHLGWGYTISGKNIVPTDDSCYRCHDAASDINHSTHGGNQFSCANTLCHDKTESLGALGHWSINENPACENCHNDQLVPLHNITAIHQSTLTLDCQACHSNYLPDTHADIANRSYNDDSCAVCHDSTNTTVLSAIANNDTNCATCHTLHGDITEIHTFNTTTSTLNCPDCHQPTYLPDLHNDSALAKGLPTSCYLCHSNIQISISDANSTCTTCHDSQLPTQHANEVTKHTNTTANGACISCHGNVTDGSTYLPATHNATEDNDGCNLCHNNVNINIDIASSECISCHGNTNQQLPLQHANETAKHTNTTANGACISCHGNVTDGSTYLPDTHNATVDNGRCDLCHNNQNINIDLASSECTSCHGNNNQQLPLQHANETIKHTNTTANDACVSCHGNVTDGSTYLPATHNATEDNGRCDLCHNNVNIDIDLASSECTSCHGGTNQQLPLQHANETAKHTTNECSLCHGTLNGSYLPYTHNATVENGGCDLCHGSDSIVTLPNNANCDSCHGTQIRPHHDNLSSKHTFESPSECDECHGLYLSTIHVTDSGTPDCFLCHRNNLDITYLPTDKNCTSCHGGQIDQNHLNENTSHNVTPLLQDGGCLGSLCHGDTADVPILLPTLHENVNASYDCSTCHDNPEITITTSDCSNCHTPHGDVNLLHDSMNTSSCFDCHEDISGSTDIRTVHNDNCAACHDNANVVYTGVTDCTDCHSDAKVPYHVNIGTNHTSTSDDCIDCHNHDADLPTTHDQDCLLCHGSTSIITLPNNANCDSCHGAPGQLPVEHVNEAVNHTVASMEADGCLGSGCHDTGYIPTLHENANASYNCLTCHNADPSRIDWINDTITSSCDSCHTIHGDVDELHNSMNTSSCLDCHESIAGSTDIRTVHNDNCAACHDNANVVYVGVTDCTDCHSNTGGATTVPYHTNESTSHSFTMCGGCHRQGTTPDAPGDVPTVHNATEDNGGCVELCHANPAIDISIVDITQADYCYHCHGGFPASPLSSPHARIQTGHNFNSSASAGCMACHDESSDVAILHSANVGQYWTCVKCHESNLFGVNLYSNMVGFVPTDKNCSSCHGSQLPQQHVNEGIKHISASTCIDCHDSDLRITHTNECTLCHGITSQVTLPTNTNCDSCHGSQLPTQHANESVKHTSATLTAECLSCHTTNYLPTLHEDQGKGYDCNTCHNADPSRINWDTATSSCDSCHTLHGDLTVVHTTTASTGCAKCHDTNVLTTHNDVCSTCHSNPVIPTLPSTPECTNCHGADAPVPAHNFQSGNSYHPTEVVGTNDNIAPQAFVNGWLASSITGCEDCHADRASDGSITLLDPYPEMYPDGNHNGQSSGDLCFNCHNYDTYAGRSNSNSNFVGDGGKNLHPGNFGDHGDFGCYACHDVHTSTNRRLITDRVDPVTGDKWLTSWTQHSGSYEEDDCVSSHPECGDHNPGSRSVTPAVITGTVTDNGVAVPNAKVSSDAYGGIVAYTDTSGDYEMPNLYSGTYSLTAAANGKSQTESISVNQGDSKVLNIALAGTSTPPTTTGSLSISSSPSGANVDLDGTNQGVTPLTLNGVSAGSHTVKLTMSGYNDKVVNINVNANEETVVSETLTEVSQQPTTGSISISSSPSGANVYLDGTNQGVTPLTLYSVSAGSHIVKLTISGYLDREVNINVIAGQETVVSETLSPVPDTVSGEGYKLSKNPDFSTEDRDYSTSDTIYVKVWSDQVDYTDMNRMYFEIKDVTRRTLTNNHDGTFTGSYDLSNARRTGERDFKIRLEDDRDEEYRVETRIDISGSSSYWWR